MSQPQPPFDPLRELQRFGDSVGKMIEQGIVRVQTLANPHAQIRLDVYEHEGNIVVRTSPLDNLDPKTLEVSVEGRTLTVKGITRPEDVPANASYLLQERRFGPFERSISINIPVKSLEAKAKLSKGALIITLPIDHDNLDDIDTFQEADMNDTGDPNDI